MPDDKEKNREKDRINSPLYNDSEDSEEHSLRPKLLNEFIGQNKLKDNLAVFITAARQRHESLDHIFFSGPPGLGKTTLAGIIANEMGVQFRATSAPALDKPGDLAAILTSIGENNVFFIDEIHRLKPVVEEMLYSAMEDFEIDVVIGQGPGARSIKIPIAPFTLAGATTKAGLVSSPLYSRFGITARLNFYTLEDIKSIIYRSAKILDVKIEDDSAVLMSKCARGTPRVANRLLRRMRDFAQVWGDGGINKSIVTRGLESLEIDKAGLDRLDREILKTVIEKYNGGPVGSETLAISIGEAVDTLEDVYEPYLIQIGYLKRTPRGRMATEHAYRHLGFNMLKRKDQQTLF
ncbi:MAG: Holliday junction branch migration DNA helicase RuvB [Spirochaetes bacterium]|nr:Holliday junction branch migration DNA helicase RuvB [Spirochaetota bacterium]